MYNHTESGIHTELVKRLFHGLSIPVQIAQWALEMEGIKICGTWAPPLADSLVPMDSRVSDRLIDGILEGFGESFGPCYFSYCLQYAKETRAGKVTRASLSPTVLTGLELAILAHTHEYTDSRVPLYSSGGVLCTVCSLSELPRVYSWSVLLV